MATKRPKPKKRPDGQRKAFEIKRKGEEVAEDAGDKMLAKHKTPKGNKMPAGKKPVVAKPAHKDKAASRKKRNKGRA